MQPAPGHTAWPWLMIRASARRRQSSCHNRGRSATDLPMRPTTHMVGLVSSGSPGITSRAGRRRVESSLADQAITWPRPRLPNTAARAHGRAKGPCSSAGPPLLRAARTCCGTISRPGCSPSWMTWALPARELVETTLRLRPKGHVRRRARQRWRKRETLPCRQLNALSCRDDGRPALALRPRGAPGGSDLSAAG